MTEGFIAAISMIAGLAVGYGIGFANGMSEAAAAEDLSRCTTMLQWCDYVSEAKAADLEAATACAWYYGNCKPEGS